MEDAPPFSPALLERWFPRKGRSSSWRGCHCRHGNAALLGPTDYGAWGCRRPRGLVGSASSMDSLYVEEVAASLVREFLSRKVMSGHSETHEYLLTVGWGATNVFHQHLCTFEGGGAFHAFCSPQIPPRAPLSWDRETTFPRSQTSLMRGHVHKARPALAWLPSPGPLCHSSARLARVSRAEQVLPARGTGLVCRKELSKRKVLDSQSI